MRQFRSVNVDWRIVTSVDAADPATTLTGRPRVSVTGRRVLLELSKRSAPPEMVASTSPSVYSVPAADPARMVTPSELFVESTSDVEPSADRIPLMLTCVEPTPGDTYSPLLLTVWTCSAAIELLMFCAEMRR